LHIINQQQQNGKQHGTIGIEYSNNDAITRATQTAINSLVADGYTITSNFKSTGTGFDAYPMYSGEMTRMA